MVKEIIDKLRSSAHGSRLIVEMARHSHGESPAGKIRDAQKHLGEHVRDYHGESVDEFVYFAGCDSDVFVRAVMDYGRKQLGL